MAGQEFLITIVLGVPDVIRGIIEIGGTLADGMLVEAVETGLVDEVEDGLLGMGDGQRRVAGRYFSIGLGFQYRAEMDALLRITRSMACHRQLGGDAFYLMRHLCRQGDAHIDIATQPDGDEFVGMRGEILSRDGFAITQITVADDGGVEAEAAMIVAHLTQSEILDMQGAEGLEELRVRTLHVQLQ